MRVDVYCTPEEVRAGDLAGATAVVIDVVRATSCIVEAIANGARAVHPAVSVEEAAGLQARLNGHGDRALLCGERGGLRIDGFDLGNSPVAVVPEKVAGKRLFMSTTNGTRALDRVRDVPLLMTAALPNRDAVSKRLTERRPDTLAIVGSGWEGSYSLEDSLAAGALVDRLQQLNPTAFCANDESTAALALWKQWMDNPEACLRTATHGQRLIRLGDHDADFRCCAGLDQLSVVPTQVEPGVLRAE